MKFAGWHIVILLFAGTLQLQSQATAEGMVDQRDILIGDQFRYTLTVGLPTGTILKGIDWQPMEQTEGLEIIRFGRLDTVSQSSGNVFTQVLTMTSFDSGAYYIPAIPVEVTEGNQLYTITTNPIPLRVRTLPVATDSLALQPIKPIIEEPLTIEDVWPYLAVGLGLVFLLVVLRLWWLSRHRGADEEAPPPPPRPAHEIALEKLDVLEQSGWLDNQQFKKFQSDLTHILREYLEGQFGIRAMESTTHEILQQMGTISTDRDWRALLRQMLNTADLVKFAQAEPPRSFHDEALKTVRAFVETTRPVTDPLETTEKD